MFITLIIVWREHAALLSYFFYRSNSSLCVLEAVHKSWETRNFWVFDRLTQSIIHAKKTAASVVCDAV